TEGVGEEAGSCEGCLHPGHDGIMAHTGLVTMSRRLIVWMMNTNRNVTYSTSIVAACVPDLYRHGGGGSGVRTPECLMPAQGGIARPESVDTDDAGKAGRHHVPRT